MRHFIILLLAGLFVYACGYHEGVIQKADRSYLMFTGNWKNASVQIDNRTPFELTGSSGTQGGQAGTNKVLYEVLPGKHTLKVFRDGRLVVNRVLFLEDQGTMEVRIP